MRKAILIIKDEKCSLEFEFINVMFYLNESRTIGYIVNDDEMVLASYSSPERIVFFNFMTND